MRPTSSGCSWVCTNQPGRSRAPSLALPVSLVGTFALMSLLGYSLDNLSLMALTLAVGFVVDDAIVMLENVVRHIERGERPFQAALSGSKEVAFTIVSMTISLAAVFLPVLFLGGLVARVMGRRGIRESIRYCEAFAASRQSGMDLGPPAPSGFTRADPQGIETLTRGLGEVTRDGALVRRFIRHLAAATGKVR